MTEPTATELGIVMNRISALLCILLYPALGCLVCDAAPTTIPYSSHPDLLPAWGGMLSLGDMDGRLTIPADIYNLTYVELAPLAVNTLVYEEAIPMYGPGVPGLATGQYSMTLVGRTEGETLGYALNHPDHPPTGGEQLYIEEGGYPLTCLIWRVRMVNHPFTTLYESECVPVHWVDPVSCSMATEQVVIDHGTVAAGTASTAETSMSVTCSGPTTARLSLPDGTSSLPVGSGSSTLTAQGAPIGGPITLKKGPNEVVVQSVLRGVGAGMWSSSVPIVLSLD